MAAEKEGHVPPSDSVLFILVCFSIGVLIRLGLKWTKIPYTAMLLVRADTLWLHAVCACHWPLNIRAVVRRLLLLQLFGLAIGFLQLAHPATQAFTNTLQLWLVSGVHELPTAQHSQLSRKCAANCLMPLVAATVVQIKPLSGKEMPPPPCAPLRRAVLCAVDGAAPAAAGVPAHHRVQRSNCTGATHAAQKLGAGGSLLLPHSRCLGPDRFTRSCGCS